PADAAVHRVPDELGWDRLLELIFESDHVVTWKPPRPDDVPAHRSRYSSSHAIWIASRSFSLEAFGSSEKPGSSVTHRWRSVKRTVSGSRSGWCSLSAMAISSVSRHVIISESPPRRCRGRPPGSRGASGS